MRNEEDDNGNRLGRRLVLPTEQDTEKDPFGSETCVDVKSDDNPNSKEQVDGKQGDDSLPHVLVRVGLVHEGEPVESDEAVV